MIIVNRCTSYLKWKSKCMFYSWIIYSIYYHTKVWCHCLKTQKSDCSQSKVSFLVLSAALWPNICEGRSAETVKSSLSFRFLDLNTYIHVRRYRSNMPHCPPYSPTSATNIDNTWNSSKMRENGMILLDTSDKKHDLHGSYSWWITILATFFRAVVPL